MRLGTIYSLQDPRTNEIRYVGQTIVKPKRRYDQHIYQWKRSVKLTYVNSWIKNLAKENLKPIMNILQTDILEENLDEREIFYIKLLKFQEKDLCNHTDGGKGSRGYKVSEESKLKRLETLKTSIAWKERSLRHSEIMKNCYKNNKLKLGLSHFTKEEKDLINKKKSETIKQLYKDNKINRKYHKVKIYNEKEFFKFGSVKNAAKYLNLCTSSIQRCCKYKKSKLLGKYNAEYI